LLGRVLELDAGHKEARALLDRLRRQERRMRQVLVGAGSLAAIGLVAAGVLLVPPDPPAEEYLESPLLAKAGPKTGGAVIPGSNDTPRANSAKDGASEDVPEEGEAGDGDDEAGVAPEEPPTKKKGNAPKRTTPPALAATGRTPCAVLVDGIPSGSRTNFRLEIQGTPYAIPQSGPVKFSLNGEAATATIVTNDLYKGSVRFGVEDCKNGDVLLDANLRPAKVTFKSLPPKTSVTCVKGCPKDYPSPQEPESMVPLPMRNLQVSVTFKYQADGFFEASKACLLTPGPNVCNVVLKPRPG
jgi:hypothetical protein